MHPWPKAIDTHGVSGTKVLDADKFVELYEADFEKSRQVIEQ
jgi:hypothetical protein